MPEIIIADHKFTRDSGIDIESGQMIALTIVLILKACRWR